MEGDDDQIFVPWGVLHLPSHHTVAHFGWVQQSLEMSNDEDDTPACQPDGSVTRHGSWAYSISFDPSSSDDPQVTIWCSSYHHSSWLVSLHCLCRFLPSLHSFNSPHTSAPTYALDEGALRPPEERMSFTTHSLARSTSGSTISQSTIKLLTS